MSAGKQKAEKSGVEIGVWQARLRASQTMYDRLRREREDFERALALSDGVRDWSAFNNVREAALEAGYADQSVPLSFRYAVWLQAQTAGDPPVIKYPRSATGDETFAVTVEDLLLRVWIESGSMREWQNAIFDLCGFGSSCVWYGFHADVTDAATVASASEGAEQVVQGALMGDTEARPGQDRGLAAHALTTALEDPINRIALPIEAQRGLVDAAAAQGEAALKEAKTPQVPAVKQREIWARRLAVGKDFLADNTVDDQRDWRWVARRIVMHPDAAKAFSGFTDHARSVIKNMAFRKQEGVEPLKSSDGKELDGQENGRLVAWQIIDKEYGTQHYVSLDISEFLEADESYPFPHPTTGEPAIPGVFPCVVSAPIKHAMAVPERVAGVPLISPGYSIQRQITSLHNFAMASVKRHSVRGYEVPENIDKDVLEQITAGEDGFFVKRPDGVEPGKLVSPIQFTGEAYRIVDLIGRLTGEWSMIQGMPMADLTSQPQADTATAEQIGVTSGRNQADFVIRQIEADMARGVEIERAMLAIGLYPPEKIATLIGPGHEDLIAAWQASSLDGDAITLKSASRAKAEQVVRTKQLGDALALTVGFMDPMSGLPVYDASPIVEEILLSLDVGRPKRIDWPPEVVALATQSRMMMAASGGAAPPGGGEGEAPNRGEGAKKRGEGPPDAAHEGAAARRTGT